MVRWSGARQVNVKSQSELDIGGHETCIGIIWCKKVNDCKE